MLRRPTHWFIAAAMLCLLPAAPVLAQDVDFTTEVEPAGDDVRAELRLPAGERVPAPVFVDATATGVDGVDGRRPMVVLALYGSLATLHAADAALTVKGLGAGAHEVNPLMRGDRRVMTLTKVATTAATVLIAEKMWKRNKAAAIASMVAANAVTAVVVARNAAIVSAARR
jgi:hypothetical protein